MINDIQLKPTEDGTFDWNFIGNDIENVNGNQRLLSAVVHAVLLRKNELEQNVYSDKGCTAHEYQKLLATPENLDKVAQAIRAEIVNVPGVSDASVEMKDMVTIHRIVILKNDGKEVMINGI